MDIKENKSWHRVVIIGGGFGGLYAAKTLGDKPVEVTIIDKRNFHLFQPLLYQVATGGLSPGDIASPLRAVLNRYKNIRVIQGEAKFIDTAAKYVLVDDDKYPYDSLIVSAGSSHHYFGNDQWSKIAPGLKTIEDAINIRSHIFQMYENAEKEKDSSMRAAWMTFIVIGGGPTGVELAGALGELAFKTLKDDFRNINPADTKIYLIEGASRILPSYPESLSFKAEKSLNRLGVSVKTNTMVIDVRSDSVMIKSGDKEEIINSKCILWAAGIKASSLGQIIAAQTGATVDRAGRLFVSPDLSLPKHPEIIVIGDLAVLKDKKGNLLPGTAPVAMQEGRYAANLILNRIKGKSSEPFHYFNKGNLAVIGRNAAVADFGLLKFSGFLAWVIWVFVHIGYLIEFDNKMLVLFQWAWNYITRKRGARLITGQNHS